MNSKKFIFYIFIIIISLLTLTACVKYSVTVNFVSNGGSEVTAVTADSWNNFILPEEPTRAHYHFVDWYYDDTTFSQELTIINSEEKLTEDVSVTVYAKWVQTEFSLAFDTNNGSEIPLIYFDGVTLTLPNNPVLENYVFDGWFYDELLTDSFTIIDLVANPIYSDTTVYAKWAPEEYTITFNSNGGNNVAPIETYYNDTTIALETPIWAGYIFSGWYYDNDTFTLPCISEDFLVTPVTDDIMLYAHWTAERFVQIDSFERKTEVSNLGFTVTPINSSIAQGNDMLAAVLHLINVAELNYKNATNIASVTLTEGSGTSAMADGSMKINSLYIRDNGTIYEQNIGKLYKSDPANLLAALQMVLDQGYRLYSVNTGTENEIFYLEEPKHSGSPTTNDTFPYGNCNFDNGDLEIFNSLNRDEYDNFYLKYPNELTNFVVSSDSILANSYSVNYNAITGIYTVDYEINLTTQESRDNYSEMPRAYLRKVSYSSDLEIIAYKVSMELYNNGLLKSYCEEKLFEGTINVSSFLKPHGTVESKSTTYYNWNESECTINGYVDDGIIEIDWIIA